ncbi:MAG: hypothetical protein WC934_14810 [Acidithiobacillus sp.]|jgi:hypothetical protein|uniref:hypothetical protein n=1 Tax=Acidithiobacillus sp. TaxID=1872118 RepID=UPI0035611683
MKRTTLHCDFCGSENAKTIFLETGTRPDGAGGPSNVIEEEIEVCLCCMIKRIFIPLEKKLSHIEQEEIFKIAAASRSKIKFKVEDEND